MIRLRIRVDGREHDVEMDPEDPGNVIVDGDPVPVKSRRRGLTTSVAAGDAVFDVDLHDPVNALVDGRATPFQILSLSGVEGAAGAGAAVLGPIKPPMTGRIESVIDAGTSVVAGDVLFVLEAMKMRNEIKSPADAVVKAVHVSAGDNVDTGTVILELSAAL